MSDRPKHPSGKPIRKPHDGTIIPRMQKQEGAQAIGFTARIANEDDD